jgi:hypothetical protein
VSTQELEDVAATMLLDARGAAVRIALADAGVPSLLLKGRTLAVLLYGDGAPRVYADCDLLVPSAQHDDAASVLIGLGFTVRAGASHAVDWYREADGLSVDLHHTLPQVDADPALVWATLSARAPTIDVGGVSTRVLDSAACAMLVALHVAHAGVEAASPREDLARAVEQLDHDCWRSAAELARELGAQDAMATGLRLVPAGVPIAERLGLTWAPPARVLLGWNQIPYAARRWEALATAPTLRERGAVLAGAFVRSPEFMRERSALARTGMRGLVAAYMLRSLRLPVGAVRSFGLWRRARRVPPEPWSG